MTNKPMTMSCICIDFEKQIVLRTRRLIRVRNVRCLRSIFCVFCSFLMKVTKTRPSVTAIAVHLRF